MAGKVKFDQESAFKSILGTKEGDREEKSTGKGRPKANREIKKRVSLALYPSSYGDLQKIAYIDRKSVSDIVSALIADFVANNADKLKEYEKIKME